jgi:hypothetical protein
LIVVSVCATTSRKSRAIRNRSCSAQPLYPLRARAGERTPARLDPLSGWATSQPTFSLGARGDARDDRGDDAAEVASWIVLSAVGEQEVVDGRDECGCERVGVGVGRDAPESLLGVEVFGEGSSE